MEAAIVRFYFDTQTVLLGSPTPAGHCQTWMKVKFWGEEALSWRLTSEYKVQVFRIPGSSQTHLCQALVAEAALGSLGQLGKLMGASWTQCGARMGSRKKPWETQSGPSILDFLASAGFPFPLSHPGSFILCERKLA